MCIDERHGRLVLSAFRVQGQNGQVGADVVPVEGHEGPGGCDEVSMGTETADGEISNQVLELRDHRRGVFVLGRLEPPSHGYDEGGLLQCTGKMF